MPECEFCKIAEGKSPAVLAYRDEGVVAFMDKNPINPGHILVIPRLHVEHLQNLEESVYLEVMRVAQKISRVVNELYSPRKMGLAVAGFDVPHAHLHVIPLHDYHDLTSSRYFKGGAFHRAGKGGGVKPTTLELEREAEQIRREWQ